jgi:pentatricopeptide repeat protein
MRSQHVKPTSITLGCMVEALVTNSCTEDAFDLVQQLHTDAECKEAVNAVIYCSILKGFAREKKLKRVWDVYQEVEQRQVEMSLVTFNTVMDACARVGRMEHADKIMQDMKRHHVEPNLITYSTLLKGHCQAGDVELAFSVLRQMKQQTQLKPDEIMYNSLIDGCAQNSLYAEGMQVYDEMMQDGVRPSNFTLSILVKLMNRTRKVDQAFSLVRELSQKYRIKPNAHVYTNLIQACVSNRRQERAVSVLETMVKERVQPDQRTYGVLIRASVYQSNFQQAIGLLRTAMGLPGALETLSDARIAVCNIDSNFVNDTLSQLAEKGCLQSHIAPFLADLKKSKHRIHIDPAMQRRVTGCFR